MPKGKSYTVKSQADQKVRMPKTPLGGPFVKGKMRTGKVSEGK